MRPFDGTFVTIFYMQGGGPPCKIRNLPCNLQVKLGLCNLHRAILASTRREDDRLFLTVLGGSSTYQQTSSIFLVLEVTRPPPVDKTEFSLIKVG